MSLSFIFWSFYDFENTSFALCGKTIASLKRNIIVPMLPILTSLGFECKELVSKNYVEISYKGRINRFYLASEDELALINKFTVKQLTADEVFTFDIVLCDNEIDRDGERFDDTALEKLKELFVGVTGIFDHVHSSKNQTARIYYTEIIEQKEKLTSYNTVYKALKAKAYIPKTQANTQLIENISAGILKEVSICCSVSENICSICNNDIRSEKCSHIKGAEYAGKVCHCILKEPFDAYEWSFVAVPAQPAAGVTKRKVVKTFAECEKSLKSGKETVIDGSLSKEMGKKLARLEAEAQIGRAYRGELIAQTIKYSSLVLDNNDGEVFEKMCRTLNIEEIKKLRDSFFEKAAQKIPLSPQLAGIETKETKNNNEFIF